MSPELTLPMNIIWLTWGALAFSLFTQFKHSGSDSASTTTQPSKPVLITILIVASLIWMLWSRDPEHAESALNVALLFVVGSIFPMLLSWRLPQDKLVSLLSITVGFLCFRCLNWCPTADSWSALSAGYSIFLLNRIGKHPDSNLSNLALPLLWFGGMAWLGVTGGDVNQAGLLTGSVALVLLVQSLLSWVTQKNASEQTETPKQLLLFIFPVLLIAGTRIITDALLLSPTLSHWMVLLPMGLLGGFLLQWLAKQNQDNQASVASGLSALVVVGTITLATSRLFGTAGFSILGLGFIVSHSLFANHTANNTNTCAFRNWLNLALLFIVARVLLQVFVTQYNPNVTGINITHPYASAALLAGLVIAMITQRYYFGLANETPAEEAPAACPFKWVLPLAMAAGLNYFWHAEATGSLLVILCMAGLGFGYLMPIGKKSLDFMLPMLSILMSTFAVMLAPLIAMGDAASRIERFIVIAVLLALFGFMLGNKQKMHGETAN